MNQETVQHEGEGTTCLKEQNVFYCVQTFETLRKVIYGLEQFQTVLNHTVLKLYVFIPCFQIACL